MSKKIIKRLSFFVLCSILLFHTLSKSFAEKYKFKIENLVEGIPILPSLIENKRDVVEFDSSNGKIISMSFDIKNLSKNEIFSFYQNFFTEKKWQRYENENLWETKNKRFKKKIFKIENLKDNILTTKIIIENF